MSKLAHSNDETMAEIEARNRFMDARANYFAMCLLMPEDALRKEVNKYAKSCDPFDDRWISKLSKKFGVEPNLMLVRLGQLGFMASA